MSDSDRPAGGPEGSALFRGVGGLDRVLGRLERLVIGGAVLAMAAVVSVHVASRVTAGLLNRVVATGWSGGITGAAEIAQILMVVITFAGVSYAVRCSRHISMSAIYDQLRGRARKAVLVLISTSMAGLMLYLTWVSVEYVVAMRQFGWVYPALQIERWRVYCVLPLGFFLAAVQYALTALRNITTAGIWRSFHELEAYAEVPHDPAA